MFISKKYKLIFIHIQKTGGNSISKFFSELDSNLIYRVSLNESIKRSKHCFLSDIDKFIAENNFTDYLKFATIRNPFDRLVSWYEMIKGETGAKNDVMIEVNKKAKNFEEFLQLNENDPSGLFRRFFANQLDYIAINKKIAIDKILRFETLTRDFEKLLDEIGIKHSTLYHENISKRKQNYRDYYTEDTKKLIETRYRLDFETFGYDF